MANDDDWEPAYIPPRGTRWNRDGTPIEPGSADARAESSDNVHPGEQVAESERRGMSLGNIVVGLGTAALVVAWWGALGVDIPFVYISAYPMLDFLVLSVASIAWVAFVYRWLTRH